jgi:hypothetical protein
MSNFIQSAPLFPRAQLRRDTPRVRHEFLRGDSRKKFSPDDTRGVTMFTVESCLRNAAGCEREARSCDDQELRDLLMRIAKDWRGLAAMEAGAAKSGQPSEDASTTTAASACFWGARIQASEFAQREASGASAPRP